MITPPKNPPPPGFKMILRFTSGSTIALANAKFPIRRVEVKTFTISSGTRYKIEDHLLTGQLPKRVFIGLVLNEAFNGTLETNPFFFQHFNLSKMDVTCDGHSVYGKPFEPRFGNDQYLRSFLSVYQALASQNQVQNNESGPKLQH